MKVLFVSSGNVKGGTPTNLVLAQGNSLIQENINVTFFTIIGKGLFGYLRNVRLIREVLRKEKFDVIHAHYGYCGIVSYLAKKDEKVINSLMGGDILGDMPTILSEKIKDKFFIFLIKIFSRFFYDFTIVKSKNLADKLWKNTQYEIIPNGVDFTVFYPIKKELARAELNVPQTDKIVLFAADNKRIEKNYLLAQKACDLLGSDVNLRIMHGVSQQILNLNYNAADVVLLTSIYEGSPNVIKESLAANRVIVSTDVGDVKERIQKIRGCFITTLEPEDVAQKIKSAFSFSESEGRTNIEHLQSKLIASRIINIYNKVIN